MKAHLEYIHGGSILIVDRDVDLCLLLKVYFLRKGVKVSIAHSIQDVLNLIPQLEPDVVIISETFYLDSSEIIKTLLTSSSKIKMIISNQEIIYYEKT